MFPDDLARAGIDDCSPQESPLQHLVAVLIGDGRVVDISARVESGLLHRVLLHLAAGTRHAIGTMDRASGSTEEVLEVSAPGRRRRITEIAKAVHHEGGVEAVTRRDEWLPVAAQRGVTAMCAEFLDSVRDGRRLVAADALESHRLCEQIVAQIGQ